MTPASWLWQGGPGAPPCFLRGTRILTASGEVAVEDLAIGMVAATLGGGTRRIVWVGSRRIEPHRHPNPAKTWPVRVRRGALAAGTPARDLLLSPDHALLLNRVLVPAGALINGSTVLQDPSWARLDYFHVALDAHDVLLAEGAPAESFPDRGSRAGFAGERVSVLHPRFAETLPAPGDCAIRTASGPAVQEARCGLLMRARALGHAITREPDLHLLVDGERVNPSGITGPLHRFAIPEHAGDIRIVSRAGVPAETDPGSEDRRRLGVRIGRIAMRAGARTIELAAGDPALREGFHPEERLGGETFRWTDGHARLPPAPPGLSRLDLTVLGAQAAWARAALPDAPVHRSA